MFLLQRILFSLGGSFLHYANHFKLYSSFCASHSKAQKVLNPGKRTVFETLTSDPDVSKMIADFHPPTPPKQIVALQENQYILFFLTFLHEDK